MSQKQASGFAANKQALAVPVGHSSPRQQEHGVPGDGRQLLQPGRPRLPPHHRVSGSAPYPHPIPLPCCTGGWSALGSQHPPAPSINPHYFSLAPSPSMRTNYSSYLHGRKHYFEASISIFSPFVLSLVFASFIYQDY